MEQYLYIPLVCWRALSKKEVIRDNFSAVLAAFSTAIPASIFAVSPVCPFPPPPPPLPPSPPTLAPTGSDAAVLPVSVSSYVRGVASCRSGFMGAGEGGWGGGRKGRQVAVLMFESVRVCLCVYMYITRTDRHRHTDRQTDRHTHTHMYKYRQMIVERCIYTSMDRCIDVWRVRYRYTVYIRYRCMTR